MKLTAYSSTGKASGTVTLPKEIFAVKVNQSLMSQAVKVYLANQRQATKKAKTRGEISGSTKKIYRQKGTGRARHGDRYAPIFVGGGVAHGPKSNQNYKLKLTKSMRRRALFSALTSKAQAKEIIVVTKLENLKPKTKLLNSALQKITTKTKAPANKLSLILDKPQPSVIRAARNLPHVTLLQASLLNPYQVLNGGTLIFLKDSIATLKDTFLKSKKTKPIKN